MTSYRRHYSLDTVADVRDWQNTKLLMSYQRSVGLQPVGAKFWSIAVLSTSESNKHLPPCRRRLLRASDINRSYLVAALTDSVNCGIRPPNVYALDTALVTHTRRCSPVFLSAEADCVAPSGRSDGQSVCSREWAVTRRVLD